MRNILAAIEAKQSIYAQSALFEFMQNKSIPPLERLAFVPCSASFILGFTDICKYAFRQEPANSKVQAILNQHTYEDGDHWKWFIEDMASLGFNSQLQMNDALNFLWHDETKISRLVVYKLYQYIVQSSAIEKLVILETIESTADIFFSSTKKVTDELHQTTRIKYKYFGGLHLAAEQGHEAHSDDVHEYIKNIRLDKKTTERCLELVEKVYELFKQWNQGLLRYALAYQQKQLLERLEVERMLKTV